ncbi:hypothetical protein [Algibacter sp. L4_22]|uniref:hypothetical protein n=1 Tax=Algibacter sp. L4_22 TaxID=2942477 RepID=UPI00201B7A47|nr:hypothetical protein [Algibacter sp. L4_22]MCL5126778.1 hypothetical protein [Algibacter sp. L4_22]
MGRLIKQIQVFIGIVVCLFFIQASGQISKEQLSKVRKVIPTEKVVVHTNKSVYLAGETLYYKFYSLTTNNKPSDVSNVGYVQLIGANNYLLFEHKLNLEKGLASSDFFMPSSINTGHYKLLGYTKWMENNVSSPFFVKDIYVINPFTVNGMLFQENQNNTKNTVHIIRNENVTNNLDNQVDKISLDIEKQSYATRSKVVVNLKSNLANVYKGNYSLSIKKINSLKLNQDEQVNESVKEINGFYLPEIRSEIISGKVLNKKDGTSAAGKIVTLVLPGKDYIFKNVKTNDIGAFYFNLYENYKDAEALIQVQDVDRDQYDVVLDSKLFLYSKDLKFNEVKLDTSIKPWLLKQSIRRQIENAYANSKKDSIVYRVPKGVFYDKPSLTYVLDDYKRFSTVRETFVEVIQNAAIRESKEGYSFRVNALVEFKNSAFKDYDPLVLVDGYLIQDNADIVDFDCDKIESISLVRGIYFSGPVIYNGVLDFKTKKGDFRPLHNNEGLVVFNLEAPQVSKLYYHPNYTVENESLKRIPDYRTQLLWVPNLELKKENNTIEFYTSDVTGDFIIVLEGYSVNGDYIKSKRVFKVGN